jgi:hypothetical protein
MCALCPRKIVNSVAMCIDFSKHQFISQLLLLTEVHLGRYHWDCDNKGSCPVSPTLGIIEKIGEDKMFILKRWPQENC